MAKVSWCDVRDESSDDQMNEHLRSPDDFRAGKGRNATSEASTSETGKPIGIGLVEALGMTANGEVPQVSAQPAMASGTAPSAQSFCKMVVLPVVAIPILRKWWIYAPGEFIKQKEGRIRNKPSLDSSITPWIGGKEIQPMFRVLVEEIPAAMLRCAECVKAKGLCIKNQKQVDPGLCPICERHRCGHGAQCTRKNFSCKWCHFERTGECFFSKKDSDKYIPKLR
mmetsp:Transcript_21897/g.48102  ORF Transcript_21897/g.48102 Transcript_21897/m.48102 type:complete len:225 (-) Transcript_21897:210-884(-)